MRQRGMILAAAQFLEGDKERSLGGQADQVPCLGAVFHQARGRSASALPAWPLKNQYVLRVARLIVAVWPWPTNAIRNQQSTMA